MGAWPMLEVTLTNRSAHAVHSFALRFLARTGGHASGSGVRPEGRLLPGATFSHTSQEDDAGCVAVCVDFVQYASGDVWHARGDERLVTEAGVQAGARAAAIYLQNVLTRSDAATVMAQLARVHADVRAPLGNREFGPFGFYEGVTNMAVRAQAAFERDGQSGVETLLRSEHGGR